MEPDDSSIRSQTLRISLRSDPTLPELRNLCPIPEDVSTTRLPESKLLRKLDRAEVMVISYSQCFLFWRGALTRPSVRVLQSSGQRKEGVKSIYEYF
ncbi:hypothetical protein Plhal304r1_c041g0119421 [Plasmopara halstedii]